MTEVSTESVRWLLIVTPELGGTNRSRTVGTTGSAVSPEESHPSEVVRAGFLEGVTILKREVPTGEMQEKWHSGSNEP